MPDWTNVAEIKWRHDGILMVRKQDGPWRMAREFCITEQVTSGPGPVNLLGCNIGPPPPPSDVGCVTVQVKGLRALADGLEVQLRDGKVVRLDRLFELHEPGTTA